MAVRPRHPATRFDRGAARRNRLVALVGNRWRRDAKIPAERSKSGEARIIPLSSVAIKVINTLPRVGDYVFSANGSGLSGWSKAKKTIDTAAAELQWWPAGGVEDFTIFAARWQPDCRRLGIRLPVFVESALGHIAGSRAGVVGVYQRHAFAKEQRAALEQWGLEVERIAGGKKQGQRLYATIHMAGNTALAAAPEIKPIDRRLVEAIKRAEAIASFDPLVECLRKSGARWGPAEYWWLEKLLERLRYKRKKPGNFVPVGQSSRKDVFKIGAAYVRKLQAEGKSREAAIDETVRTHPDDFGADAGASLQNFMKRGSSVTNRTSNVAFSGVADLPAFRISSAEFAIRGTSPCRKPIAA